MSACTINQQESKLDSYDGNGESDARPVEMFEFHHDAVRDGEKVKSEKGDCKRDSICHQKRNREIHIRWRALGGKVIERAGANREGDGKVEEEHRFHFYHEVLQRSRKVF
jgi:hypothetical protein